MSTTKEFFFKYAKGTQPHSRIIPRVLYLFRGLSFMPRQEVDETYSVTLARPYVRYTLVKFLVQVQILQSTYPSNGTSHVQAAWVVKKRPNDLQLTLTYILRIIDSG